MKWALAVMALAVLALAGAVRTLAEATLALILFADASRIQFDARWFGTRGLVSIVFAVIVVEQSQLPHVQTILLTTYVTVGLSVLAHGLSAAPLVDRYARWYDLRRGARMPAMESCPRSGTSTAWPRPAAACRDGRWIIRFG